MAFPDPPPPFGSAYSPAAILQAAKRGGGFIVKPQLQQAIKCRGIPSATQPRVGDYRGPGPSSEDIVPKHRPKWTVVCPGSATSRRGVQCKQGSSRSCTDLLRPHFEGKDEFMRPPPRSRGGVDLEAADAEAPMASSGSCWAKPLNWSQPGGAVDTSWQLVAVPRRPPPPSAGSGGPSRSAPAEDFGASEPAEALRIGARPSLQWGPLRGDETRVLKGAPSSWRRTWSKASDEGTPYHLQLAMNRTLLD
eukprot:TRINITY_DN43274_c0_g1_i1.p1 TRINITY_DN43274_c0_g1~~TRINITY_DN43274_c0_g1_i1.p1  ORF type:complete len:249 (+),score=47.12 TRINITY_DN43274_c0_g1_i1:62-808(+)